MPEQLEQVEVQAKPVSTEAQTEAEICRNFCIEAIREGHETMGEYYLNRTKELGLDISQDPEFQEASTAAREEREAKQAETDRRLADIEARRQAARQRYDNIQRRHEEWRAKNMTPNYTGIARNSEAWAQEAGRRLAQEGNTPYYRAALKTAAEYKAQEDLEKM